MASKFITKGLGLSADQAFQGAVKEAEFAIENQKLKREDIHDLVELTVDRMDVYHLVGALLLGFCIDFYIENSLLRESKVHNETPRWILELFLISNIGAVGFLIFTVWLSMHASVAAHTSGVRLLVNCARITTPNPAELQDFGRRMTVVARVKRGIKNFNRSSSAEAILSNMHGAFDLTEHKIRYLEEQQSWLTYDGYARACMAFGINQMAQALSYWILGPIAASSPTGAIISILGLHMISFLVLRLDMVIGFFCRRRNILGFLLLSVFPNVFAGFFVWYVHWYSDIHQVSRDLEFAITLVFLLHFGWILYIRCIMEPDDKHIPTLRATSYYNVVQKSEACDESEAALSEIIDSGFTEDQATEANELRPGVMVRVDGTRREDRNGKLGVLLNCRPEDQRWSVRFDDGERLYFRPESLTVEAFTESELKTKPLAELKGLARTFGASETEIEALDNEEDQNRAAVRLILAKQATLACEQAFTESHLQTKNLAELKRLAGALVASETEIEALGDEEDPDGAAVRLILAKQVTLACEQATFFLPKVVMGITILKQLSDGGFLVDTSELQKVTGRSGIAYRRSKHVEDKVPTTNVNHGETIRGLDEGDGWIKVKKSIKAEPSTQGAQRQAGDGEEAASGAAATSSGEAPNAEQPRELGQTAEELVQQTASRGCRSCDAASQSLPWFIVKHFTTAVCFVWIIGLAHHVNCCIIDSQHRNSFLSLQQVHVSWASSLGRFKVSSLHCNESHIMFGSGIYAHAALRYSETLLGSPVRIDLVDKEVPTCSRDGCLSNTFRGGDARWNLLSDIHPIGIGEDMENVVLPRWNISAASWVPCNFTGCQKAWIAGWDGSEGIVVGTLSRNAPDDTWQFRERFSVNPVDTRCVGMEQACRDKKAIEYKQVRAMHLSDNGRTLVVLLEGGFLDTWDLSIGTSFRRSQVYDEKYASVCYDGRNIFLSRAGPHGPVLEVSPLQLLDEQ